MAIHEECKIFEGFNEAVYIIDTEGRVQFCNPALTRLIGYPVEALLGRPSLDLYAPEDRPAVLERRAQAFKGEVVPTLLEATFLRHDGARLPVEISLSSITRDGEIVGRLVVARDISARKQAETALRASEERFRLLVEGVQDYAIYLLNPEGYITTWNTGAQRINGYTAAEVFGKPYSLFFPPDEQARGTPARLMQQAIDEGHAVGEGWRVRKDGSHFWASFVLTALYDSCGQFQGFAKMTRDVTERRQAEQALEAANAELERRVAERTAELQALNTRLKASLQEKEVLLKEIHHRVKNNLQVVLSLLSLQGHEVNDPRVLAFFRESERRIHAMTLVHETIYEAGELGQVNLRLYIPTLSTQLVRTYLLDPRRVAVHLHIAEVSLPLELAVPCGLILSELLSNCLKHAFPDERPGDITVTLTHMADCVSLSVKDNGCGFPAHLDFRNAESLGLQLVHTLTEQLQGTLTLERSEGTAVTLTFPVSHRSASEGPSARTSASGDPHG